MTHMRRAKQETDKSTTEHLDELNNIIDEEQLNLTLQQLAANPFFNNILARITQLEAKILEYERHEHKAGGEIVLRV